MKLEENFKKEVKLKESALETRRVELENLKSALEHEWSLLEYEQEYRNSIKTKLALHMKTVLSDHKQELILAKHRVEIEQSIME
jgi:hypothetical protein